MLIKKLSIKFVNLLVKELKTYMRWLDTSVYTSKITYFMVLLIPPPTYRKFNPTLKNVKNKFSKLDQADLDLKDQE